jgi:hypothetical protein
MNTQGTDVDSLTVGLPSRFRLIDRFGVMRGNFATATEASEAANRIWPGEPQDPDRLGVGWDIETA